MERPFEKRALIVAVWAASLYLAFELGRDSARGKLILALQTSAEAAERAASDATLSPLKRAEAHTYRTLVLDIQADRWPGR